MYKKLNDYERSPKLATLAVETCGRLGVEGSKFIDQLAASSVVGGRDGGSMARNGVVKEGPLQNRLGDYTGRHFEEGVALQTPA